MPSDQETFPRILGVDPGLRGAITIMDGAGLTIIDVPVHSLARGGKIKSEMDVYEFARWIDAQARIDHAFIEKVASMPGQGVSSVFSFGKTFGQLIGVIAANFIPMTLVPPQTWKKSLKVPAAKDGARARASELMPAFAGFWNRVKDDGRAEATLLAYYGYKTWKK